MPSDGKDGQQGLDEIVARDTGLFHVIIQGQELPEAHEGGHQLIVEVEDIRGRAAGHLGLELILEFVGNGGIVYRDARANCLEPFDRFAVDFLLGFDRPNPRK